MVVRAFRSGRNMALVWRPEKKIYTLSTGYTVDWVNLVAQKISQAVSHYEIKLLLNFAIVEIILYCRV